MSLALGAENHCLIIVLSVEASLNPFFVIGRLVGAQGKTGSPFLFAISIARLRRSFWLMLLTPAKENLRFNPVIYF